MKRQWGLARARKQRMVVIEPKRNELQVDLDGARAILDYASAWFILQRNGIITAKWKARFLPSKKRGHAHVIVTLPYEINHKERILLQCLLGSDLKRESFNYCRVVHRNKYPIALFRKADT